MRKISIALLSPLLMSAISCGPPNGPISFYVGKLKIDEGLHMVPIGSRSLMISPPEGNYYSVFHAATGLTLVSHWDRQNEESPRLRLSLTGNREGLLDETLKRVNLLGGPFGTIVATKKCFFNRPLTSLSSTSFELASNDFNANEPPTEVSNVPKDAPLTSVSLVRIFRTDPEFVMAGANYEPDGSLGSLIIGASKGGKRVPERFAGNYFQRKQDDPRLTQYGIPFHLDIPAYLKLHRLTPAATGMQEQVSLVNEHYAHNRFIRIETLLDGAVVSSRVIQPSVTEEEQVLDPVCEARFDQQRTKGLPSLE